ncbi:MAG: hypothetical protein TRG1_3443 [Flavobacteriaceae bacterium FS1-H7996/R]|nr:MAG: hypothetical protein TRG1_3443 [Flavobacteriaceae bacterium FS1-H7996/R]
MHIFFSLCPLFYIDKKSSFSFIVNSNNNWHKPFIYKQIGLH